MFPLSNPGNSRGFYFCCKKGSLFNMKIWTHWSFFFNLQINFHLLNQEHWGWGGESRAAKFKMLCKPISRCFALMGDSFCYWTLKMNFQVVFNFTVVVYKPTLLSTTFSQKTGKIQRERLLQEPPIATRGEAMKIWFQTQREEAWRNHVRVFARSVLTRRNEAIILAFLTQIQHWNGTILEVLKIRILFVHIQFKPTSRRATILRLEAKVLSFVMYGKTHPALSLQWKGTMGKRCIRTEAHFLKI